MVRIKTEPIGIGNYDTLHGTPDGRLEGKPYVYVPDEEEDNEQDTSSGLGDEQDTSSIMGSSISSDNAVTLDSTTSSA